jgi:hypothetical protein
MRSNIVQFPESFGELDMKFVVQLSMAEHENGILMSVNQLLNKRD